MTVYIAKNVEMAVDILSRTARAKPMCALYRGFTAYYEVKNMNRLKMQSAPRRCA